MVASAGSEHPNNRATAVRVKKVFPAKSVIISLCLAVFLNIRTSIFLYAIFSLFIPYPQIFAAAALLCCKFVKIKTVHTSGKVCTVFALQMPAYGICLEKLLKLFKRLFVKQITLSHGVVSSYIVPNTHILGIIGTFVKCFFTGQKFYDEKTRKRFD